MPIQIQANTTEVIGELQHAADLFSSFESLWDDLIHDVLSPDIENVFDTEGLGQWSPRVDDLPHPILDKTGRLKSSYTQSGADGNIDERTPFSLRWGSDVEYADFHEQGTSRLPARPVIDLLVQSGFEQRVARYIDNWIDRRLP